MDKLGKFVLGLITSAVVSFVIMKMWGWFIVPLGILSIGFFHAWGLKLIASAFTMDVPKNEDEFGEYNAVYMNVMAIFMSVILLGFGWVAKTLM